MPIIPNQFYFQSYLESFKEGFEHGQSIYVDNFEDLNLHHGNIPFLMDNEMIVKVPTNHFWLVKEDKFIGSIDIRSHLDSPNVAKFGGHIGYGIRKSERGNGYGTFILKEGLKICKGMGLGVVKISAHEDNIHSQKVIINNGGLLIKKINHMLVFLILLGK